MTIIDIEGFETRSNIPGGHTVITGRFGTGSAIQRGPVSNNPVKFFDAPSIPEFTTGVAWLKGFQSSEVYGYFDLGQGGTRLSMSAAGEFIVLISEAGSSSSFREIARSSPVSISPNGWFYLEFSETFHATEGKVKIKLNGTTILDLSNLTTLANYTQTANLIGVSWYTGGSGNFWDDMYLDDEFDAFHGECNIVGLTPNANGDSSQFVGSDGNSTDNYLLVDEIPANTADYVAAETPGSVDLYGMSNLPAGVTTVSAVKSTLYATKTDTGEKIIRPVFKSDGSTAHGANHALGSATYGYHKQILTTNPATGLAWTPSEIDALQMGVEVVS